MADSEAGVALQKRLEQRVRRLMLDRELWPEEGPLLLAVSGGPDSTALLLILDRLAKLTGVRLTAAYLDHGLREPEAIARERAFAEALCAERAIAFVSGSAGVRERARRDKTSLEDAARRERYEFLAHVAGDMGAAAVATGHTASDQAETVLLHLIRGTGLDGLAGMRAKAAWPLSGVEGLSLVRPLLVLNREETLAYCRASGVDPLLDESNELPDFTRNRVRNELLPRLRTFNPRIEDALVRLADAAAARPGATEQCGPEIDIEAYRQSTRGARSLTVRSAIASGGKGLAGITSRHIAAVDRLLRLGTTGDVAHMPGGLQARRTRSTVVLETAPRILSLPRGEVVIAPGCELRFGTLVVALGDRPLAGATAFAVVDAEAARNLRVRRRRPGDRFQPLGMQQEKKLQDFFVDEHVPRHGRDSVPLFVSDRGIAWVGGYRIAEWARPYAGRPALTLSFRRVS
jgi:tRNA(Ile)-lysidine synthase